MVSAAFLLEENQTGLGEPLFPSIFAALANSLYKATGNGCISNRSNLKLIKNY